MSFASINLRTLASLTLCAALVPLLGCTDFQTLSTGKWLDGNWLRNDSTGPVIDMLAVWDNRVLLAEDPLADGMQRPGLVGRLVLMNDAGFVDAHGKVVVKLVDLTYVEPGRQPEKLGEWSIPQQSLKRLKQKDRFGDGYLLFLPWPNYHPAIKHVQVQVCYIPDKGTPRYSSPSKLMLQTDDSMQPIIRERNIVPVLTPVVDPATTPIQLTPGWSKDR